MTIGCVVTACGIPQKIIDTFLAANRFQDKGINLYITSHWDDNLIAPGAIITEIEPRPVFNIGYAANVSIREAIKKCDIIVKTDIDCVMSTDCLEQIKQTDIFIGFCYRYWEVDNISKISEAVINTRTMGTIALSAIDWRCLRGYDERLEGYGFDDRHIYDRAKRQGININVISEPKVYHISHNKKHNCDTINPVMRDKNTLNRVEWIKQESSIRWGCNP